MAKAISQLGIGEALVSTLQDKGIPMPVERTLIAPPRCRMGAITDAERAQVRAGSPVGGEVRHRRSTANRPRRCWRRTREAAADAADAPPAKTARAGRRRGSRGFGQAVKDAVFGTKRRQGMVETMAKQTARTVGSQIGRQILRGVLGGIFGGSRR